MRSSLKLSALVLFVVLLPGAGAVESRPEVALNLKETAIVRGPEILIVDLADLPGSSDSRVPGLADLSLGPSPMPGETRIVTRADVCRSLEAAGLRDVTIAGAPQVRISRSSRLLTRDDVAPVLKNHIAALTVWKPEEIDIRSVRNLDDVRVPEGNTTVRVATRSAPSSFRGLLLPLEVSVDGRPVRIVWIKADIRVSAGVVQAARGLPYGRALTGEDVRPAQIEITDPRATCVRSVEAVAGKVLRRSLKTGELITEDALADPLVVRSGDTVRLRFEKPNIRLVMMARAEQDGRMGQSIRVRNLEFARVLKALVVGPGEVLIQ